MNLYQAAYAHAREHQPHLAPCALHAYIQKLIEQWLAEEKRT